jgi:BlaI family penicillinase repressor
MMLTRMADKGAVRCEEGGRSKLFYPSSNREDAATHETRCFLSKV